MFDDFFQSVKAALYDRVSSPLWGAFFISWVAWNYKFLIVLISSMTPDEKFSYISAYLYPELETYAYYWAAGPFVTAALIIGVVPAVAEAAYRVSRFWKVRLKKLKLHYDGVTPISQEEADLVLRNSANEKRMSDEELRAALSEKSKNQELYELTNSQLGKAQSEKLELEKKLKAAQGEIRRLSSKSKESNTESIRNLLINGNYKLRYNAEADRSKIIEFKSDGSIGDGRNQNEFRWDVDSGVLVLYTDNNEIQNQFSYDERTGIFNASPTAAVKALPNQTIFPISEVEIDKTNS